MKRYIVILCFLLPFVACAQQDINLGTGVLFVDYEKLPTIKFYSDTSQRTPVQNVSVVKDSAGEYAIKNAHDVASWFKPEGLWLDYGIFVIRVDTQVGTWYKVYVNNETGMTLWTRADSIKKFSTWENFLVHATTAIEKSSFELEIKVAPRNNAKTIKKIESTDCFKALEIKGDWLRIRTNDILDCNQSKKTIESGWIKWKLNSKLTISYGLTC